MNKDRLVVISIVIIFITFFTGCATQSLRSSLPIDYDLSNHPIFVDLVFEQKNIEARVPDIVENRETPFGLVGAVIESSINSSYNDRFESFRNNKDEITAPLRNALLGFDVKQGYHEGLLQKIGQLKGPVNTVRLKILSNNKLPFKENGLVLKVESSYGLNVFFNYLEFFADVTLTSHEADKKVVVYKNLFRYLSPPKEMIFKSDQEKVKEVEDVGQWYQEELVKLKATETEGKKRRKLNKALAKEHKKKLKKANGDFDVGEKNLMMARSWTENDASLIKGYLLEASSEIIKMIYLDLKDHRTTKSHKKDKLIEHYQKGLQLVKKTESRVIVRDVYSNMSGQLCSMDVTTVWQSCWWQPKNYNSKE